MKRTILVIDNHPNYLECIASAFSEFGSECTLDVARTAGDAQKYLEELKHNPKSLWPKLILLNLDLPGFNGFDIMEEIKGNELTRMIPLIVYSTSDYELDINYCYLIHANAYVRIGQPDQDLRRLLEFSCKYWMDAVQVAY